MQEDREPIAALAVDAAL